MKELINGFKEPSTEYRPAPLWTWNDEMTREQIDFQLTEMYEHGFGGVFVHPRPGLVTEYLSDEWFEMWGYALKKAKELGMKISIYDENSYPSGFAGGHVSSVCPEALSTVMRYKVVEDPSEAVGERIAVFAAEDDGSGDLVNAKNVTYVPETEWPALGNRFIVLTLEKTEVTGWMAGFAYVDLLRPQVHEMFMKTTHEKYYKYFGEDFGKDIPSIFTDEPSIHDAGSGTLPFSYWLAHEFKKRSGYSLLDNLPCVFANVSGECFDHPAEKVRFDFYDTIHELWVKNSIEATGKWCEEHGINWTGHYLEHQWPHVSGSTSPSVQSYYEYHQWPAIDFLMSYYLKDQPTHTMAHTIRELKSASNQFAKERAVCELYGAGGWESTFDDYKRLGDYLMVNGVNYINQHLVYSTINGARKHDHPQSFDWREPWWDEYTVMNDYLSRVSWMLSQGKMEQRILVLNPSTTAFLTEEGREEGDITREGKPDCVHNPDMTEFLTLSQMLTDLQWDFDLGDEYTLSRHAKAENGKLEVVKQKYSCVFITGSMKNMLSSTAEILKQCIENGVHVMAVGRPGCYIDGAVDEAVYAGLEAGWQQVAMEDVDRVLEAIMPRRITASVAFPEGFNHMRRKLDNGSEVWFFANQAMDTFEAEVTLPGRSVKQLDLFTGEVRDIEYSVRGDRIVVPVNMVRNQSLMFLTADDDMWKDIETANNKKTSRCNDIQEGTEPVEVDMKLCGISRESDNVYPISYVDYEDLKGYYVKKLCERIFKERGFPANPWEGKVQFRRNIMEHETDYDASSGFTAAYRFDIEEGYIPEKISVAAEFPEYCRLRVNGKDVQWSPGETWLDYHIGVADIAGCVRTGENVVEVIVDVFHVRFELDTVYIRGDFSVVEKDGRWILTAPDDIKYGSWKEQGMPFYSFAAQYEYSVDLEKVPDTAELLLEDYEATAVSLTVNGQPAGLMHADGKRALDIAGYLKSGENRIAFRVCGSHKNLLGPHFARERGSAWAGMWWNNPDFLPDAKEYDLFDYGIYKEPKLIVK